MKLRLFVIAIVVGTLLAAAQAQPPAKPAPALQSVAPVAAPSGAKAWNQIAFPKIGDIKLPEIKRYTLPNGMKLFLVEDHSLPIIDGSATATITGSILDSPASLTGTATLEPLAESGGARLKFRATVEVRVPLVGGKLENFIGNQLVELLIREQRFTTTWIGETT